MRSQWLRLNQSKDLWSFKKSKKYAGILPLYRTMKYKSPVWGYLVVRHDPMTYLNLLIPQHKRKVPA